MTKFVQTFIIFTSLSACYICPDSDIEATERYTVYRDAACEAVEDCNNDFMHRVRVYEAPRAELPEICNHDKDILGCYCSEPCYTIVLDPKYVGIGTALHEYIHAAIDSAGVTSDENEGHDTYFWESYRRAAEIIESDIIVE